MKAATKATVIAAVAVLFVLAIYPLAHATYPPQSSGSLDVSKEEASPGSKVVLSGSGFAPHAKYDILWDGKVDIDPEADASGNATYTYTIPSNATAGTHTISMSGPAAGGGTLVLSSSITINGSGTTQQSSTFPFTGGGLLLVALAAGIVLVGTGFGVKLLRRVR